MLMLADELGSDLNSDSPVKGSLKLGSYESLAIQFLPSLMTTFRTLYPNFKLDIVTSRSDTLVKQVKNGSLNMALVINGKKDSKVEVEQLSSDTLGLYVCAEKFCYTKNIDDLIKMGIAILSTPEDGLPLYYKRFTKRIPEAYKPCLLYTSPSPRDLSTSRMPSSA